MAYGLVNAGNTKKNQALSGIGKTAQDENQRNIANDNIKQAESNQKKSNAGMGASTGAMIGAQMAGSAASTAAAGGAAATGIASLGVGGAALATGGIGLAAGLLLSELF